jgi:sensor domain CHASE-containing protein
MGQSDYHLRRVSSRYGSAQRSRGASLPPLSWFRNSPLLVGLLVAGLLLAASLGALRLQRESTEDAHRASLRQSVGVAALLLQADLLQAFSVANSLELLVQTTGHVDGFDKLAQGLMLSQPLLSAIALAPGGVIQQVAPMDSQGALIGRNMFDDPAVSVDLNEAIRLKSMVISRPQILMTGGVGVIARLPVFRPGAAGDRAQGLWGFVLVQVKLPDVANRLDAAGLTDTDGHYALATTDPDRGHRIAFYPFPAPRLAAAESAKIMLPQRQWTLMVESPALPASDGVALKLIAAAVSATAGLACALWQRHRLMHRARRNFYRESANSLLSDIKTDGAHRVLDRVRHLPGWALLLMVRLPLTAALPGATGMLRSVGQAGSAAVDAPLRAMLRKGDLLLPLGGSSFLILAHSMEDQPLALWVRDRLIAQVQALSLGAPVLIHHRLLRQPETDIRQLFAEAVAEMHLDAAAARRDPSSAPGSPSLAADQAGGTAETLDPRDRNALSLV